MLRQQLAAHQEDVRLKQLPLSSCSARVKEFHRLGEFQTSAEPWGIGEPY